MPTALPHRLRLVAHLTFRQSAHVLWLAVCIRSLGKAMERAGRQSRRPGNTKAGDRLLRLARRWLARNDELSALLDAPEPAEVRQVRSIFEAPAIRASKIEASDGRASRPRPGPGEAL